MVFVVDMNLSPDWVALFNQQGWAAYHWTQIGSPQAADEEIMAWAVANSAIVFTQDLDFGTILAYTRAQAPSVIQLRTQRVLPLHMGSAVVDAILQFSDLLAKGVILTLYPDRNRGSVLPLRS